MYNILVTIRKLSFSIDEYYHIYSRGVDKRIIFLDDNDRHRFMRLMFLCNGDKPVIYRDTQNLSLQKIDMGKRLVAIGAYCLMPNHRACDNGTVCVNNRYVRNVINVIRVVVSEGHVESKAPYGNRLSFNVRNERAKGLILGVNRDVLRRSGI